MNVFNFDKYDYKDDTNKSDKLIDRTKNYTIKLKKRKEHLENLSKQSRNMSKIIQMSLNQRHFFLTNLEQYYDLLYSGDYIKKSFDFATSYYSKKRETRVDKKDDFLFFIEEKIKLENSIDSSKKSVNVYIKFYLVENIMSILEFKLETDNEEEKIEIFKLFNDFNRQTHEIIQVPIKEDGKIIGYENQKNYIQIFVYNMKEEEEDMLVKCRELGYIEDYVSYNLLNNIIF